MSNNALPRTLKGLLARAEDCADGAHELEDEIPLVLIRESNLRAHLQALKGDLTATPPVAGLIYLFKVAENERKAADSARALKDKEVNTFLVNTRARLALYLGSEASAAWGPTGFLNAQGNSNAVPDTQDDRLQCLATLGLYLNAHPAYEQAAGTPAPEVTHTRALALHAQFPDAEHPVVRTHPETGEKVLFVNAFTTHFTNFHNADNVRVGQDYAPGASQLLQYLISQAFIPEYQVRWRWKPNSMAMWDNRSTQHYAVMDYPPCHRKMERAGIVGDATF